MKHLVDHKVRFHLGWHSENSDPNPFVSTCWTLVQGAANGEKSACAEFARIYQPIVKTYLTSRWGTRGKALDIDDAIQDVFVDLLGSDGALRKIDVERPGGFRPFLFGVVRNVARRHEERLLIKAKRQRETSGSELVADETGAATDFERAWAKALMKEAGRLMEEQAKLRDQNDSESVGRAVQRVELLKLRFQEALPIRDIAQRWGVDAAWLHHEYATARQEFREALLAAIAFQDPQATPTELDAYSRELLKLLG